MDLTTDELAARLDDAGLTILDVRTRHEYDGTGGYPCDPRQGHLPGARNLPVEELLEASPDEIRQLLGPDAGEVVTYCHSGGRSARAAAALAAVGYDARNYAGSWHEWSRREDLPAAR